MDTVVKTRVIKRNGEEVTFDQTKIVNAIEKANQEIAPIHQMKAPDPGDCGYHCSEGRRDDTCGSCGRYTRYGRDRNYGDAWV